MKAETDLVVVMLNFGSVESDSIEDDQKALAEIVSGRRRSDFWGQVQSDEARPKISVTDEAGGSTRNCLVLYGMGALLSGETYASSEKDTDISAVVDFSIVRNNFGETSIQSFTVTRYT